MTRKKGKSGWAHGWDLRGPQSLIAKNKAQLEIEFDLVGHAFHCACHSMCKG